MPIVRPLFQTLRTTHQLFLRCPTSSENSSVDLMITMPMASPCPGARTRVYSQGRDTWAPVSVRGLQ